MPGREDGIETKSRMNASYLNSESYAGEEEVVITFRLFRKLFLSMIDMEQDKDAITEDETENRSDEIKHFYCVPPGTQGQLSKILAFPHMFGYSHL